MINQLRESLQLKAIKKHQIKRILMICKNHLQPLKTHMSKIKMNNLSSWKEVRMRANKNRRKMTVEKTKNGSNNLRLMPHNKSIHQRINLNKSRHLLSMFLQQRVFLKRKEKSFKLKTLNKLHQCQILMPLTKMNSKSQ